jgi:hypothetical protein
MADLLNNPVEEITKDTLFGEQARISLLDLADNLDRAISIIRAVELGLQSHRITTEVSGPLLWVIQDGLQRLDDVATQVGMIRD